MAVGGDWDSGHSSIVAMPIFHVAGVNIGLIGLVQGLKNVILGEFDPTLVLDLMEQHKIRYAFYVPAVIMFLNAMPDVRERDFSSLKLMLYGASPIAEDVLLTAKDIFKCDFVQVYGLTETSGAATALPPEDHDPARGKLRSCGLPNPNTEIRIMNEDGKDCAPHEVGEIIYKSGALMKGYWRNPEATTKAIRDGWFWTGDAGYLDEEGYLYIHDRVKDMIVSGAENIYPAEIENALFAMPEIGDVAVIGIPDDKWGESVKAVVVVKPGETVTAEEIIAFARTKIAGFKTPRSVDFVDALPRNPSGKILKKDLRAPYWKGRDRQVG